MLSRVGGLSLIFLVATAGWLAVGLVVTGIITELLNVPMLASLSDLIQQ